MFYPGSTIGAAHAPMKRLLLPTIICLFVVQLCAAQSVYQIKGTVADTLISSPLFLSSVVLLRSEDTVIETFTRANDTGAFTLQTSKPGKYLLQISRPGYAEYSDVITLTEPVTNLGTIAMLSKEHMLKEFVFTQQVAAIKIKGDTTEYMADSFNVKTGASVEDLLKKLPGIRVDKNGQITAQGETVQKVLVDGEEFFSDDPKVVTQGLQANTVEKVQVFDKKSDQALFTGIDDGEKTKTINLQLKENMKKGFFGKADAGGGSDGYFQEQLMANAFKGKRQAAVFGIASNTDKVGLGWQENDKYGGGSITEMGDDGSYTMYSNNYDEFSGWDGTYRGDGLPKVWTGGAHFANKWKEDKQHLSGSYRYALQQVDATGSNSRLFTLGGDSTRINRENKYQFNTGERHKVNGLYEWKIDSTTSLKLIVNAGKKKSNISSRYLTETYNNVSGTDGNKTSNERNIRSLTNEQSLSTNLLLRKKFAKKGRTFSLDINQNYNDTKGTGQLGSKTYLSDITGTTIPDTARIDQRKVNNSNLLSFYSKATYTEPLSKAAFIEANYSVNINNNTALNSSYDKLPAASDYTVLRDSFSSNYRFNILTHRGGLSMKFVYKKLSYSFGSDISNASFLQTDMLHGDTSHRYNFINVFPKANFSYKMSKQTSINLSYNGNTKQPTIAQIQPLNQNTDPLNIVVGNPELKQEFTNRFGLRYNNYKVLSNSYTYAGITFTPVSNAISTAQYTDGALNTTRYINVDGNYSGNWYSGYSFQLKKPELKIQLSFDGNTSRTNNMINDQKNVNNNNSFGFGPTFSYEKENKYEFSWNPNATYNDNRSTVNSMTINYWVLENELMADVQITKDIDMGSTANIMLREQTVVFTDNNRIIKWNAYVSKKFLKKKDLMLKLSVFDILNQNLGFTRTAQGNMITQNSYNTIRRYGMLSLTWNFKYTPGATVSDDDDDD
ncbi:MAG: outer membrane beta-barrel protein [Taibaiella sp.]|nr:outer membrane beta-barrel protein [Taibaiella sp.]